MINIIQLIAKKVKDTIEESVIRVLEGDTKLDNIVDLVDEMVNNIGVDTIGGIIEGLNDIVKKTPERSEIYHIHKINVPRILITRFGELEFNRPYYKNMIDENYGYIVENEDYIALQIGKSKEMKLIYVYGNKRLENKDWIKLEI